MSASLDGETHMKLYNYTVLGTIKHNNRLMYKVQCDCGKIELKRKDHVETGHSRMCKSCSSKETAKNYPPPNNNKYCGNFSGTHFNAIKHGALRRKLIFNVSQQYLWDLFLKQKGKCAISGIEIVLSTDLKKQNVNWDIITASVDRIDNSIGYVPGNVWWVHKEVNRLKNNLSMEKLLYWSKLIVATHGNPERSSVNEITVAENVQRLEGEDSTNNPSTNAQLQKSGTHLVYEWFKTKYPELDEDIV